MSDVNRLLAVSFLIVCLTWPCLAGINLISHSRSYELQTKAGADQDEFISPVDSLPSCLQADTVSTYSSDFCWSEGAGDPLDSAWALLFGDQQSCVTMVSGSQDIKSIKSTTSITGGVIYPGCDLGNPLEYASAGHAMVKFVFEVTDHPAEYSLSYAIIGEDWGGEIMGGITTMSGFIRMSSVGGAAMFEDTLFLGANASDSVTADTLQPGIYEITYQINHAHGGVELLPWFPAGYSRLSFELKFTAAACGDLNASGRIDISDAVYLINYIFGAGAAPQDSANGDVNCSSRTDISDAVYMVNYIFASGPAPCAGCM